MALIGARQAPTLAITGSTLSLLDSVGDMAAWSFEARVATAIAKVMFRTGTLTGAPGTASLVLCADNNGVPNISGGIPVDIGGGSPTLVTHTSWASTTTYTDTLTNAYTPTVDTKYWVVLYASAGTWDASNRVQINRHDTSSGNLGANHSGLSTDGAGASWTITRSIHGMISLLDASNNVLANDSLAISAAATTAPTTASNPDEYGVLFTVPANCTAYLHGFWWLHRINDATNSDHTLFMYTDPLGSPVLLDSKAIDVSVYSPFTGVNDVYYWRADGGPFTLTAGTVVSCSVQATGTGTLTFINHTFDSQAVRESSFLFRDFYLVTRNNGSGVFTAQVAQLCNLVVPHLELVGATGNRGLRTGGRM